LRPELTIDSSQLTPQEAAATLLDFLTSKGIVQ
jgi:hypothetical protein